MKTLMLGNEALARGAYEAGVAVVSSYPGTPSTEITEYASDYPEIYVEWAPNEKVAVETACGASLGGVRALSCMKHVGLNVAADPLYTASYTGVNGGLVIVVADDPGMHSSQNEQDSRNHARGAQLPMLEPADSQEAVDFIKAAYEISEKYDTPVLIRTTTRMAHARSLVTESPRADIERKPYKKDPMKYVMMPGMAKVRHLHVEKRMKELEKDACDMPLNRIERGDDSIGVICSGAAYQYVKEAAPEVSVLKLGVVNPLPRALIEEFARSVGKLYVIEELEPVFEEQIKSWGIECVGKELTGRQGELSARRVMEILGRKAPEFQTPGQLPGRPPVMCPGCPHRGTYYVLSKMHLRATGDIGCYTLGALKPNEAIDSCLCMGASIGMSHGLEKATGGESSRDTVAVIGDSTFVHSGITGLINAVYNHGRSTVLILDNSTTAMTGHQPNPTVGYDIRKQETYKLDLETVCRAVGVNDVKTVDPYDLDKLEAALKDSLSRDEVSVIIARRPCALLTKEKKPVYTVDADKCRNCGMCLKVGCPAIERVDGKAHIDPALCVGCDLCARLCKFSAIGGPSCK